MLTSSNELRSLAELWNIQNHIHTLEFLSLAERAEADGYRDVSAHLAESAGTIDLISQCLRELLDEIESLDPGKIQERCFLHGVPSNSHYSLAPD